MRRRKSVFTRAKYVFAATCVAGALAATTTATKADGVASRRAPPPAAPMQTTWSGFYFGAGSGYQWSSVDVNHVPGGVVPGTTGIGISSDHDDAFVSVHLGVQHQFGTVVLGLEGGWMSTLRDNDGSADRCDSVLPSLQNPQINPGNFCSARLQDILTIGARLGWAAGHWMPYLAAGYANAAYDFNVRAAGTLLETAHERLDGWYIGGGFEWTVSPGWTVGLEYRHYEFEDGIAIAHTPGGNPQEAVRFDATTDTVSARVSWRWGRPEPAPARPLK